MKRQVIVVGAGPSGATAAYYLAKADVDVLLVDKETWPRDKACGDGQRMPAWSLFKDMGVWDEIMQYATPSWGVTFGSSNGKVATFHSTEMGTLCTPRKIVDDIVRRAALRAGADFMENFEVTELIIKRGFTKGVRGFYQGKPIEIECDAVVIADGAHSMLARQLGLFNEDPDVVFYGARGYFENVREMTNTIEFYYPEIFYPSGYMWVFPMTPTKGNVGVFITEGALQRSGMKLEDFFSWWRDNTEMGRIRLGEAKLVGELKGWRLPACYGPRDNYANGALVAGDAGNMIEAAYGGGQDLAMIAGKAAAEVLAKALPTGDLSAKALSVYKDKLMETQMPIYAAYNAARKFLFTNPEDLNQFVEMFKDRTKAGPVDYSSAVGEFLVRTNKLKPQKDANFSH